MSLIAELSKKAMTIGVPPQRPVMAPYQLLNGNMISLPDNGESLIKNAYDINDTVFSIINMILNKVKLAPWAVYKVIDESSLKLLKALLSKKDLTPQDYMRVLDLRFKSFELVRNPGKIGELLKYPNDYDSWNDFIFFSNGYKLLTGNKYIWADLLEGGANKGMPNKLWTMPSQFIRLVAQGGFPAKVIRYELPGMGITGSASYDPKEVLHEKEPNYDYTVNGTQLIGVSKLRSALKRINNSNSALDVSTAKFQNGGMEAIIFSDDPRFTEIDGGKQMTALKQTLINEYTGPQNAGKIAISGTKVGVAQLGYTPVELNIIAAEINNLRFLCNVFEVPSQLLNDPDNKSFNNAKEGEKALTSRCALPLLNSTRDNLNRKFHTDWGMDKSWLIDYDISIYGELQQDTGDMMKWVGPLATSTGMPFNRILELLGQPKIDNPLWDEPWVTSSMGSPLSQWEETDVDRVLNDSND